MLSINYANLIFMVLNTTFSKLIKLRFKLCQHTVNDNESSDWLTNQNTGATNVAVLLLQLVFIVVNSILFY